MLDDDAASHPPAPPARGLAQVERGPSGSDDDADAADLLPPDAAGALGTVWDALADRAAQYATRARGAGTRRTYRSAWTPLFRSGAAISAASRSAPMPT